MFDTAERLHDVGHMAFLAGQPIEACPYDDEPLTDEQKAAHWKDGWRFAFEAWAYRGENK